MPDTSDADPPIVGLERLAAALRHHRITAGFTTAQVTSKLHFSPAKLSRIETGNRAVRIPDLIDLCNLYGVSVDERERFVTLAEESRQESIYKQQLRNASLDQIKYLELESTANAIDDYKSSTVTALLQTPGYARAILRTFHPHFGSTEIEQQVDTRLRRLPQLLERPRPPRLRFIVDEAALDRVVGGPKTMSAQLGQLNEIAQNPHVSIRVISHDAGAHAGMDSLFSILTCQDMVPDRIYVDGLVGSVYLEREHDLRRYRATFADLTDIALSSADSAALIADKANRLG